MASKNFDVSIFIRRKNNNNESNSQVFNEISEVIKQLSTSLSKGSYTIENSNGISINQNNYNASNEYIVKLDLPNNNRHHSNTNNNTNTNTNTNTNDRIFGHQSNCYNAERGSNRYNNNSNYSNGTTAENKDNSENISPFFGDRNGSRMNRNNNNNNNNNNNHRNNVNNTSNNRDTSGISSKHPIWDLDITNICYDEQVQSFISNKYKNIGKLWKYNPQGLLTQLKSLNIMAYSKVTSGINVSSFGSNDKQVITNYQSNLLNEVDKLLPKNALNVDKIKQDACNTLYNIHLKETNNSWPKVNRGADTNLLKVNESNSFNDYINKEKYIITWYMDGSLTLEDEVQSNNNMMNYYKACKSNGMQFKLVLLNKEQMDNIDKQLEFPNKLEKMKNHLDSLNTTSHKNINDVDVKQLMWDQI